MLQDARAAIAVREEELTSRMYELDAKEARLDAAPAANGGALEIACMSAAVRCSAARDGWAYS